MKLKDILIEQSEVKKFREIIQKEQLIGTGGTMYRGVKTGSDKTKTFKKIKIRKDRRPRNIPLEIDAYLEGVRKKEYKDRPSRRKSLFITPMPGIARMYGEVFYVMAPKTANVWMMPIDPYLEYFESDILTEYPSVGKVLAAYDWLLENSTGQEIESTLKEIKPAMDLIDAVVLKYWGGIEQIAYEYHKWFISEPPYWADTLRNPPDDTSDDVRQMLTKTRGSLIPSLILRIHELSHNVDMYYRNLIPYDDRQVGRMEEVIVEGDYYYLVNKDWYEKNF